MLYGCIFYHNLPGGLSKGITNFCSSLIADLCLHPLVRFVPEADVTYATAR